MRALRLKVRAWSLAVESARSLALPGAGDPREREVGMPPSVLTPVLLLEQSSQTARVLVLARPTVDAQYMPVRRGTRGNESFQPGWG